jgi:hypothetical protein
MVRLMARGAGNTGSHRRQRSAGSSASNVFTWRGLPSV